MSLFRNENPILGPSTKVRNPVLAADVKPQTNEPIISTTISASAVVGYWVLPAAPEPMQVKAVKCVAVAPSSAALTMAVRKITADGQAPSAAAGASVVELLSADINIGSGGMAANTVTSGSLSATAGALNLAKGDRLAIKLSSATQTALAGLVVQVDTIRI